MKILLINYEFPPMGGGAGRATYNLAEELVNLGHTVDVITSKIKGEADEQRIEGFTVFRVPSWRKGIHDCGLRGALTFVFFAAFRLRQLVKENNYDVLHYFFGLPTGFLSLLPGKHQSIPYIVSLRGSDVPHYDIYNTRLQWAHALLKPVTRRIWKRAKKVVAVTDSLKETAHETARDQEIIVVPNGVDTDLFKPKETFEESDEVFKLICVTRLIERKGVEHLLEALAELKDKTIALSIFGTGSHENFLKNLCSNLLLNDQVIFYGYCPWEELPRYFAINHAFVLPSLAEAFGNAFAEAMACGLPVIGGNSGGIRDLVQKGSGILVEPGNVEEIKQAIITLKNSKQLRGKMGRINRQRIQEEYSWPRVAERFVRIYQSGEGVSK